MAARELNPQTLQGNQNDWINRHTVYTHGNGFVAAPANRVDEVACSWVPRAAATRSTPWLISSNLKIPMG